MERWHGGSVYCYVDAADGFERHAQFLGFGLLLTSLWLRQSRRNRFGPPWLRGFLADYGVPVMVVAWSGLSYALQGVPDGIPRRVLIPNTWDASSNWSVAKV